MDPYSDPDPGGQKLPTKIEKNIKYDVLFEGLYVLCFMYRSVPLCTSSFWGLVKRLDAISQDPKTLDFSHLPT
jgi:hypothetical protein